MNAFKAFMIVLIISLLSINNDASIKKNSTFDRKFKYAKINYINRSNYFKLFLSNIETPDPDSKGVSTKYGYEGDKYGQQRVACKPNDKINNYSHICAHRTYPCGTVLIIENTKNGQRTWCTVMDRGPYGANVFAGGSMVTSEGKPAWYIKTKQHDTPPCSYGRCTGKWRGVLDVSPAVSNDMGHDGFEVVKIWKLKNILKYNLYLDSKRLKQLI
jgi:hypothetical protein